MRSLLDSSMVAMLLVLLRLLVGTSLVASATSTPEVALTATASSFECSSGQPGGFYWCHGAHFDSLGSAKGCSWEPPQDTCRYFMYPKDVRRSIGPDAGTVCRFYNGLKCSGKAVDITLNGKVSDRLECPGAYDFSGLLGNSMKCYSMWEPAATADAN